MDGVYVEGQSPIARYLLSKDRGEYVRSPKSYETLAKTAFASVRTFIFHNLSFPIPYTHIFLECIAEHD